MASHSTNSGDGGGDRAAHATPPAFAALAPTLSLDGAPDSGSFDQSGEKNLAENYDYVMHGQLFKIEAAGAGKVAATASFGGLLMLLTGDKRSLGELALDQKPKRQDGPGTANAGLGREPGSSTGDDHDDSDPELTQEWKEWHPARHLAGE